MTVEAISSDDPKIARRARVDEQAKMRKERIAEATEEAEAKKQALRARTAEDAVKVEISSTSQ